MRVKCKAVNDNGSKCNNRLPEKKVGSYCYAHSVMLKRRKPEEAP